MGGSPHDNRNPIQVYQRDPSAAALNSNGSPMGMEDLNKDAAYYKDSVEILGLSMNEMESFINPVSSIERNPNKHSDGIQPTSLVSSTTGAAVGRTPTNAALLQRLERMKQVAAQPRELAGLGNHEIEEIGDYCV